MDLEVARAAESLVIWIKETAEPQTPKEKNSVG